MADRDRSPPSQLHRVHLHRHASPKAGPSTIQVIAIIVLLPVGATLLGLAGLTLIGTLIGIAVTTPLFIIVSPVLVPAAILLGLVVTGFISSGAFGLTGLSSFTWVLNYLRSKRCSAIYGTNHVQKGL